MANDNTNKVDSDNLIEVGGDGISVLHGSMKIDGNLEIGQELSVKDFKVIDGTSAYNIMSVKEESISFNKLCKLNKGADFNNGKTLIGIETTYNSGYVGTDTIQAGERIVVGDSLFKITADTRDIIADTFNMSLRTLTVDEIVAKKIISDGITSGYLKVTNELIANKFYSDSISTNALKIESFTGKKIGVDELYSKDIFGLTGKFQNGVTIMGCGTNGAALTVNGAEIIANHGIVSHTANNRFQTMQIMGSGTDHEVCFKVDKAVDSVFKGNVTIQESNLILDESKLISDDIIVTSMAQVESESPTMGVRVTTNTDWDTYKDSMITEIDCTKSCENDTYNPYVTVQEAINRNAANYANTNRTLKSILNPINIMMEQVNTSVPKQFTVNKGVYRVDSNGNVLMKNLISEKGRFSTLSAYSLEVNKVTLDKIVSTSVASNVVDTDNLLKSRGIAEFDGVINTSADVFVEEGSTIDVANKSNVVFQSGSSLELKNGAKFNMGVDTYVKMAGDIEIDVAKLVFVDSTTGNKYKITFRDASPCEGCGVIMDYYKVENETTTASSSVKTAINANELDSKLKSLGL